MAERFLEDHRKPVGGYDRVHFDEDEIAALRDRIDLTTPLRVHWEWDYVREVESLRALYEKGKTAQWNVETDLDWSIDIPADTYPMPPEDSPFVAMFTMMERSEEDKVAVVREELEHGLSQLLHGEQAALQLTAQLVNAVPDMDGKLFAGQQVVDECRHVEVFAKLISRKLGTVHPVDPNIKFLLDELLATDRWERKAIGMQILFEGIAMGVITDMGMRTLNPLIKQAMRLVARDEARHAAFGVLALREVIPGMDPAERDELEDWTWKCLEVVANGLLSGLLAYVGPRWGIDPENVGEFVFRTDEFWDARYHMFNHTVLPNLKKLGLITERTRGEYDRFRLLEPTAPFGTPPRGSDDFLAEG